VATCLPAGRSMENRKFYIYILANISRRRIYIGVTNNLVRRVWEHKESLVKGYTKKYKIKYLMYFEEYDKPNDAIAREKQLKTWSRNRKNKLIASKNQKLEDLYQDLMK
jgi:putative endonuclease